METSNPLAEAAAALARQTAALRFAPPVALVYRPLEYAWRGHAAYLRRYGAGPKRVIFLGMNPGPFGMAQTGVPFGEVAVVRDWLGLHEEVGQPERTHPKRPITGMACPRAEVSGRRLWGLFARRFGTADNFFREHFVVNYCPLLFMDEGGRNLTPDKFPATDAAPLFAACDEHLRRVVATTGATWLVGVGAFAEARAREALAGGGPAIGRIPHPSPANPQANRDWDGAATRALIAQGIWS